MSKNKRRKEKKGTNNKGNRAAAFLNEERTAIRSCRIYISTITDIPIILPAQLYENERCEFVGEREREREKMKKSKKEKEKLDYFIVFEFRIAISRKSKRERKEIEECMKFE